MLDLFFVLQVVVTQRLENITTQKHKFSDTNTLRKKTYKMWLCACCSNNIKD